MQPQGKCTLKNKLNHTQYYWGELSEIEGNTYPYMEFSVDNSSCMIVIENKGLVDVDIRDIESHIEIKNNSFLDILEELLKGMS